MIVIVALDGVLRSQNNSVIQDGRLLVECMRTAGKIVVISKDSKESTRRWLMQNRISYDDIVDNSVDLGGFDSLKKTQINRVRSTGLVKFLVDHDPEVNAWAMSEGITCAMFVHPVYALPKNRPDSDHPRKSWNDIQREYDKQQNLLDGDSEDADL